MRHLSFLISVMLLITLASCKTKEEWRSKTIYQILTDRFALTKDNPSAPCELDQYCGGTYQGIINHLDYIQGMGFDAIWISPIVENTPGSYHGYHLTSLYKLNLNFGDKASLVKLIEECHKRNIWVMVDVVGNHVGPVGEDYSRIDPFNEKEHYHYQPDGSICQITDYTIQWMVENCRLADLPDLKQENDWVTQKLVDWVRDTVKDYNFDGVRIDTLPEVPKWFWDKFTAAAGVFQLGEVFNGDPGYVADYQRHCDSVFNYPLYYAMEHSFQDNNMRKLEDYWFNQRNIFPYAEILGVFLENHDNPRFLNRVNNKEKFINAVVLSFTWEGLPVFYYGGEQLFNGGADPLNREPLWNHYDTKAEVYVLIGKLNAMRKAENIWIYKQIQRYADADFYAYTRGNILICLTNHDNIQRDITYHDYSNGTILCNVLDVKDCVTVKEGKINIKMKKYPKVYMLKKDN